MKQYPQSVFLVCVALCSLVVSSANGMERRASYPSASVTEQHTPVLERCASSRALTLPEQFTKAALTGDIFTLSKIYKSNTIMEEPRHTQKALEAVIFNSRLDSKRREEVVKFLIKQLGADINKADPNTDNQFIHEVSRTGSFAVLELLIKYGAKVNHPDRHGQTPLHYAVQSRHFEKCALLMDHGADNSLKTTSGRTVFDEEQAQHERLMQILRSDSACSICTMTSVRPNVQLFTTQPCEHTFCVSCIIPWLQKEMTCPNCRQPVTNAPGLPVELVES